MSESQPEDPSSSPDPVEHNQLSHKVKLLLLIYLKLKKSLPEIVISSEHSNFDEAVLSANERKTIIHFNIDWNFKCSTFCKDLYEYFKSFLRNKENGGEIEKIMVVTEDFLMGTDEDFVASEQLTFSREKDEIFEDSVACKLNRNEEQRRNLKSQFLAVELIECSNNQPGNYKILQSQQKLLTQEILDESLKAFRKEFQEKVDINSELTQLHDNLTKNNLNFEKTNLENLVAIIKSIDSEELEKLDDEIDHDLDEFLEKLIIVNCKLDNLNELLETQDIEIDVEMLVNSICSGNLRLQDLDKIICKNATKSFPQSVEFRDVNMELVEFLTNKELKIQYIENCPGELDFTLEKIKQCLKMFYEVEEFSVVKIEETSNLIQSNNSFKVFVLKVPENCQDISNFIDMLSERDEKFIIVGQIKGYYDTLIDNKDSKYFRDSQVTLSSLTELSLSHLLEETSEFQEKQIKFSDIIDSSFLPLLPLQNWHLNRSIGQNVINSKLYDNTLYIPRSFKIKNKIKINFLSEKFPDDQLAFEENEFEFLSHNFPCKNIHWVSKVDNEFLLWRKTKGSIKNLKSFVEENEAVEIFEEDFLNPKISSKYIVIVDDAGTGKSCFSNHIAEALKDAYNDHWVVHLTLNRFTHYFNDNEFENKRSVTDFIAREVLDLKTEFQQKLFRLSLKTRGNVFVILDGFDEVAPFYEKNVLNLIEILGKMKIKKIFVSTRPVLGDFLENRLNVFKYQFSEFSPENQVNYLANYWLNLNEDNGKSLEELKKIALKILNFVNNAFPSIHLPTGVPLTLKLLAESFKSEILNGHNFNTNELSLNLFKLFDRFFDEKIRIYFHEKYDWDENSDRARDLREKEKVLIREICEKLAVAKIFSSAELNFVARKMDLELVESELQAILKCGLVYEIDGEFDFIHKSLAEHLTTNHLFKNVDDEDVLDLILELVLEEERFAVIQSFMMDYIEIEGLIDTEENTPQTSLNFNSYEEDSLEATANSSHCKPDHRKSIVLGLINKSLKNQHFTTKQEKILGKILCYYIENFTDIEPVLLKINRIQLTKIIRYQFEKKSKFETTNLLFSSLKCQENCVKLLDCCFHRFKDNPNLIEDLFSVTDERGRNFLFITLDLITDCGWNKEKQIDLFFKILEKFKEIIEYSNSKFNNPFLENSNFFEKLFLNKDPVGSSIFHLLIKKRVDPLKILEFKRWVINSFDAKKAEEILRLKNQNSFCSKILSIDNKVLIQNYFEAASIWLKNSQNNLNNSFDDFEEVLKKSAFEELLKRRNCFDKMAADFDGSMDLKLFDDEFIEYFGILSLNEQLKTEPFVNLLIKSYLVDDRFKAFRSLFEHFIRANKIEIHYKLFFKVVGNYILELNSYKCSFFVTFEENNFSTFDILMNSVIFSDNEIDMWGILARKIGIDFMKIVLLRKREKFLLAKNVNLLFVSLFNEKSLLKMLHFLKEAFSKSDPNFFEGILLSRDAEEKTFLHFIFYLCGQNQFDKNQILEYFFKVLRSLEGVDLMFLEKLLLCQDSDGKTLLHLMVDINIESTEIIEFLKWSQKRFGLKFIRKFLVIKNKENFIFCDNFYLNRHEVEFEQIKFSNLLEEILLKFSENDSDKPDFDALKKFARNRILLENNYPSVQESTIEFPSQILYDLGILKKYLDRLDFEDSAYSNYFSLKGFHGFLPKSYKQKNTGKLVSTILVKRDRYKEICWLIQRFFRSKLIENELTLHTYVIEGEHLFYLLLDNIIEILETQNSLGIVEKTLFAKNVVGYSFLHVIFEYDNRSNKNFYPNLFERLRKIKRFFPEVTFQNLFMVRGHFGLTFMHLVRNLNAFESTLNFLQTEFNSDFVKSFLLLKCNTGNSLNWMKSEISLFIDLLKTLKKKFELSFIKNFLMQKDNDGRNFLFESTFSNPFNLNELIQVFDLIFIIFGRDFELFDDLFNSVGFWYNLDSENKLESQGIKKIIKEYEKKNQHEKIKMIHSWIRNNLGEDMLRKTLS